VGRRDRGVPRKASGPAKVEALMLDRPSLHLSEKTANARFNVLDSGGQAGTRGPRPATQARVHACRPTAARRPGSGWVRGTLRGDAISRLGSNLVQIWFVFPTRRIKVPYSQELGRFEGPIAVIDNDGQVEILLGHNTTGGHGPEVGITVIGDLNDSWRPGRAIWNQHAFNITNVADDGQIPTDPVKNWTIYNNFRSGDLSPADGDAAPDLTVEATLCESECGGDELTVWAHLGNVGASPLTAGATLELLGVSNNVESPIAMVAYPDPIPEGTFIEALVLVVPDPASYDSLVLRVSTPEEECDLGNNELVLTGPFCAGAPN